MNFPCPHCEKNIRAPESRSGRQGRCPACGERVTVPENGSPPPADLPEDTDGDPPARNKAAGRRVLVTVLVIAAVLAGAVAAFRFLPLRPRAPSVPVLPEISRHNAAPERYVARSRGLPAAAPEKWRQSLAMASGEYLTRHDLLFALPNLEVLWEGETYRPAAAQRCQERAQRLPRPHLLRWHRALGQAAERTAPLPLWDTAMRLVEVDRLYSGQAFDPQASERLLERFRAVSPREFARWATALDAERGQAALILVCTDGLFPQEELVDGFREVVMQVQRRRDAGAAQGEGAR